MDESTTPPSMQRRPIPSWNEEAAPLRVHSLASAATRSLRMRYPATPTVVRVAKEGTS